MNHFVGMVDKALQISAHKANVFPPGAWFEAMPPEPLSMASVGIGLILLGIMQVRPKPKK